MSEQDFLSILRKELQLIRDDIHELRVDVGELKADVSSLKDTQDTIITTLGDKKIVPIIITT